MFKNFFSLFSPTKAADITAQQLHDAELQLTQHTAAAEHHTALADMYRKRIARIQTDIIKKRDAEGGFNFDWAKSPFDRRKVTVTLDENDPNPMKTVEAAKDEIVRSR